MARDDDKKPAAPPKPPASNEPDPMATPKGPSPAPNPESAPGGDKVGTLPAEKSD